MRKKIIISLIPLFLFFNSCASVKNVFIKTKPTAIKSTKPTVKTTTKKSSKKPAVKTAGKKTVAKSSNSKDQQSSKAYSYQVRGKTYKTLDSSENYNRKGKASWYGKPFHGRKTASGEIFNMYSMSAAHKSLPFGSKVKVTNLANNRAVVVKINDRGPFHGNRLIDLSYAAAKQLGFIHTGVSTVIVKAIK